MAVKLRLARHGSKKRPYYRIVAAEGSARRDGRFLEHVGAYDPLPDPPMVKLDRERIRHWLDEGATPSHTVRNLLDKYMDAPDSVAGPKAKYEPKDAPAEKPKAEEAPADKAEEPKADAKAEEAPADKAEDAAAEKTDEGDKAAE